MPETTPLIKAALNLRGGAGFDVYELAVFYIEIRFLKANERGYQANADNPF